MKSGVICSLLILTALFFGCVVDDADLTFERSGSFLMTRSADGAAMINLNKIADISLKGKTFKIRLDDNQGVFDSAYNYYGKNAEKYYDEVAAILIEWETEKYGK